MAGSRKRQSQASVATEEGAADCWGALTEIASIGSRITDPKNVFGLQMTNIAQKAIEGRKRAIGGGRAGAGSSAPVAAAALDGVAAAAGLKDLSSAEVAEVARVAAEVIRRLERELVVEKEESASYHRFWIEERDKAARVLARRDELHKKLHGVMDLTDDGPEPMARINRIKQVAAEGLSIPRE